MALSTLDPRDRAASEGGNISMKFSCDDCGAQYMIADEKIGARGVKVRCKKCANVIILRPQRASVDPRPMNGSPMTVMGPPPERNKRSLPPPPPAAEAVDDDEATLAVPERRPPPPPASNLDFGSALGVSSDLGLSQEFAAHGFDGTSQRDPMPALMQDSGTGPFSPSSIGGSLRDLQQPSKMAMPSALSAPAGIALPTDEDLEPRTNVDHLENFPAVMEAKPPTGEIPTRVAKTDIPDEARRPDEDEDSSERSRTDSGVGPFANEPTAREQDRTEEHRPDIADLRFPKPIALSGRVDLAAFPRHERELSRTDGRDQLAGAEAALDAVERSLGDRLDKLQLGDEPSEDTTLDRAEGDAGASDLINRNNGLNGGYSHEHAPRPIAARAASESAVIRRPTASGVATGSALATSGELDAEIGSAFESIFGAGAGLTGEPDPFESLMQDQAPPINGARPEDGDKKPTKIFDTDAMKKLQDEQDLAAQHEPVVDDQAKEWYVAVNDEQVGPLSFEEVRSRWQNKEVDFNSLCWKQGMADWIAIRFVPELQPLASEGAQSISKPDEERPLTKPRERVVTSVGRAPTGTDLKPPLAAQAPTVVESAPIAQPMAHEESEPSWRPNAASALASLAKAELEASPEIAPARSSIAPDVDKFAGEKISASMFGAFEHTATKGGQPLPKAPELASNVSLREPGVSRTTPPWMWPAIVGGVVALVAVIVILLLRPTTPAPVAQIQPTAAPAPAPVAALDTAAQPPSAVPTHPAEAAPPPPAPGIAGLAGGATPPPPAEAAPPPAEAAGEPAKAKAAGEKKPRKTKEREASKPKPVEPPVEAAPPPPKKERFEADDLLAEGERGKKAAPVAEADELPERLDDADILRVLRKYKGEINTCREKQAKDDPNLEGVMTVKFVILKTGKTSQHAVQPDKFKSSSVGKCVLNSVRGWSFPRFAGPPMPLDFPVMVRGRG